MEKWKEGWKCWWKLGVPREAGDEAETPLNSTVQKNKETQNRWM